MPSKQMFRAVVILPHYDMNSTQISLTRQDWDAWRQLSRVLAGAGRYLDIQAPAQRIPAPRVRTTPRPLQALLKTKKERAFASDYEGALGVQIQVLLRRRGGGALLNPGRAATTKASSEASSDARSKSSNTSPPPQTTRRSPS